MSQGLVQPGEGMALGGQQQPPAPVGGDREAQLALCSMMGEQEAKGRKELSGKDSLAVRMQFSS